MSKTLTTGTTAYSKNYSGAVYLTFNDTQLMLTAANLSIPRFSYVADSFYTAVTLGKIEVVLKLILGKFSSVTGISVDEVTAKIESFSNLPVLDKILTSELIITEFVIQPPSAGKTDGIYSFGMGLKLTEDVSIGPVKLDGVSFTVTLNQIA
jgi:hypothetical protein